MRTLSGATAFDLDAGDLNGDGYSDAVVRAAPRRPRRPPQLYVYDGGPGGSAATTPSRVLDAATAPGATGSRSPQRATSTTATETSSRAT